MNKMAPLKTFTTRLSAVLRPKTTRARLLALFVFMALAATAAVSAASTVPLRSFFFTKSSATATEATSSHAEEALEPSALTALNGSLGVARKGHSATVLSDGRVLIVGGENQSGLVTEAEIFDPSTGSFSFSGNLNIPRADHSATRLSDGRVLIAGGRGDLGSLNSTEIFDPTTGAFTAGPDMTHSRLGPSATLQSDGRVLLAGGDGAGTLEIYNPDANSFSVAGVSLSSPRSFHSAALMLDGRVLLVGGRDADGNFLTSGEIFDPATSTLSDVSSQLTVARVRAHLRVLFDGKVQVIGGNDDGSLEVYDPAINAFGAYVHVAPEGDTCAGLPGQVQGSQTRAALFHNGQADATFDRSSHTMSELGTQATVVGGANSSGAALSSAPLFNSSAAAISTDKLDYAPGETAYVTGRGFAPGETVRIKVHEDPHTPLERGMDVVADGDGNFVGEYLVQDYDLRLKFLVGARGLLSGRTAQTSFTDASPGSLGNYDVRTLTGVTASVSPSFVASNVTFSSLTRGAGLTAESSSAGFNSSNWQLGTPLTVTGNNDYLEFTITPTAGQAFSVSELRVGLQRSAQGANNVDLRISSDSYATALATYNVAVGSSPGLFTTSLSSVAALQNSAVPVTFRLYGYAALNSGGTMRIGSISSPQMIGLEMDGTVSAACAAPTSATLLPASQTLKVGDTLTLNATVTGGTAPYNFVYKQGTTTVATHNNINSTTDSYTKTNIVTEDAGSYTVEVTSSGCTGSGTATSAAASVTVNKRTASIAVSFLANPITYGGNTTVTATVTDTDTGTPITPTGTVTFGTDSGDNFSPSNTCSLVAGVTGTASCSVTVTPTQASVHNISAAWPGDSAHSAPADGSAGLTVNPKPVTANITASNKTYDGNTAATITACTLNGVVSPDGLSEIDCSFGSATANFIDPNAGTGKTVNATGLTLTGTKTSSYSFGGTANTTANIDKAGSTTTVTCAAGSVYTGSAIEPCTYTVTGVGGLNLGPTAVPSGNYSNNINAGVNTASASFTYAGDANHNGSDDTENFSIDKVTLSVNADHMVKTYGQGDPAPTWTYSGFVNSEGPTPAGLTGSASCSYAAHSNDAATYNSIITCEPGTLSSTNYNFATGSLGNLTINPKDVTVTAQNKARYYGESDPPFTFTVSGLVSPDTTLPGVTCGVTVPHSDAGTYTDAITCSGNTNTNYNVTAYNPGTLTVNPDPTAITLDSKTSGANFDCVDNKYTATLKDTITNQGLAGVVLKLTIGTQSVTDTTDVNGLAEFAMTLNQPVGTKTQSVEYVSGLSGNYVPPTTVSRDFNVTPDVNVGPGTDATSLYTGSNFFWTTSSTSSTATLTLSATIKDTSVECAGLITTAKVSFFISTNGTSFSPVSNAQNLPVGLVDPNNRQVGTASAISQYNIGSDQSVTLTVRVVVGGQYSMTSSIYDTLITIGKPGAGTSLMGGGKLKNDGIPFLASGYFGLNSIAAEFGTQVQYNKKGVNPQGQVTVNVKSCNDRFGNLEPGCTKYTPEKWHHYFIKSNSISELSLIGGSASFGSKTNVSEVLGDSSKVGLDGGNTMQLIFTPLNKIAPQGSFVATSGVIDSSGKCIAENGCASIVIFRSAGGVWYSSSWGQGSGTAPRTYLKKVVNGTVSVGGSSPSTPTISAATGETAPATSTTVESSTMNAAPEPQSVSAFVDAAFVAGSGSLKENAPTTSATNADAVSTRRFFTGRVDLSNNKTEPVFVGDGTVGKNWIVSSFDNSLGMVTTGTAADGRVTVTVRSCNKPDGSVDTRCVAAKPSTHHVYVFETRDFSQSSVVADVATVESTGVMYELLSNGEKRILAKDVAMQIIFVPENQMIPLTIGAAGGFACTEKLGCAAVAMRRTDGGLWYSGGWSLHASTNGR